MIDFTFQNPTKIYFGRSAISNLKSEVLKYGRRILLVYGGGSIKRIGLYDSIMEILTALDAEVWELGGIQPNPRLGKVYEGISLCREHDVQLILAVGGGSAIDTGKAIANGFYYGGDVWDLFMGKGAVTQALPLGTILTIPAAGSEMSESCVIMREEDLLKRGRSSALNFPRFSIVNPEYSFSLPKYQVACGIVDIMSHMMERYFTQVENVELTDRLIEGALTAVINNAPITLAVPNDYESRAEITWAGSLAHNTLLQTGRKGDWASHKLEHELSALYDIAHGAGLAMIIPAWMKYVLPRGGEKKLSQFAARVFGVAEDLGTCGEIALEGIYRLEAFYRSLGMPVRLSDAGIDGRDIERMSKRCVSLMGGKIGVFVPLGAEDCKAVYRLALEG